LLSTQASTVHLDLAYAVVTDDIAASHIGDCADMPHRLCPISGTNSENHVIDLQGRNIATRDEYPILRQNKVHEPTPIEVVVSLSGMRQI
jgi:hypothetical protein